MFEILLDRDLEQAQRVGRRAHQRRGPDLGDGLQALHRGHPAQRDDHRREGLQALPGRPELHVRAEREGERAAIARLQAGGREGPLEGGAPPRPVLGRVEDAQRAPGGAARLVHVDVALDRERQVGAERWVVALVGDELALGQRRQGGQEVRIRRVHLRQPGALERVVLPHELDELAESLLPLRSGGTHRSPRSRVGEPPRRRPPVGGA